MPCNEQTWPDYDRRCLKGAAADSSAPIRTVTPERNTDGSPRASSSAPTTTGQAQNANSGAANRYSETGTRGRRHGRHSRRSYDDYAAAGQQATGDQPPAATDSDFAQQRVDRRARDTGRRGGRHRGRDVNDARGGDQTATGAIRRDDPGATIRRDDAIEGRAIRMIPLPGGPRGLPPALSGDQ